MMKSLIRRRRAKEAMIKVSEKALTVHSLPTVSMSKAKYAPAGLNSPGSDIDLELGKRSRKQSEVSTAASTDYRKYADLPRQFDGSFELLPPIPPIRCIFAGESYLSFNSGTDTSSADGFREAGTQ